MNILTKEENQAVIEIMKDLADIDFEKSIFCTTEKNIKTSYFYQPDDILNHSISNSINYNLYFKNNTSNIDLFVKKRIKTSYFYGSIKTKDHMGFKIPEEITSIYNELFETKKINHNITLQHQFFSNLKYSHQDFLVFFEDYPELLNLINENNWEKYSSISNHFLLNEYKQLLECSFELKKDLFDLTIEEQDLFTLKYDFNFDKIITNEKKNNIRIDI